MSIKDKVFVVLALVLITLAMPWVMRFLGEYTTWVLSR